MTNFNMPELPEGQRWRFADFGGGKELRLEEKRWFFSRTIARAHLNRYIAPEYAVDEAVKYCLQGRNWLNELHARQARARQAQQRHRDNFPDGVVK